MCNDRVRGKKTFSDEFMVVTVHGFVVDAINYSYVMCINTMKQSNNAMLQITIFNWFFQFQNVICC